MNGTYLKNTKILSISLAAAQKAEAGTADEPAEEEGIDIDHKPEISYDDFSKLQFQAGMLPGARIC